MKVLIVYSSETGNTRRVGEAIKEAVPEADIYSVDDAPNPEPYDFIFYGFWVDKGTADKKSRDYLPKLSGKNLALFATLGAYPDSDHAQKSLDAASDMVPDCNIMSRFICQGAIAPHLIAWMEELPADHPHAPDEERRKRWRDAESHPDQEDFDNARQWASKTINKLN